jgi:type I restriction enzyme, S subunit
MMASSSTNRWPIVPLGTLAEFRNGINFSNANFGSGIKVIGVGDFQSNVRASFDDLDQINPEGVVRKEHLLKNGDILFVRSNGNRELIGRSMFVKGLQEDVTHSAFSIRLRFVSDACRSQFYAYLFRSRLIREALSLHGGGTNISNLNQDILGRLEVPLPPKPVQYKIASILSAYDDLIEKNIRRIKTLEKMAQTIYREWFVKFRFPGCEKVRIVNSELGQIPERWQVARVQDFGEIITGKTPSKENSEFFGGDIPFIKLPDMHGKMFVLDTAEHLSILGQQKQVNKTIPPNTLCVSCIGTAGIVIITTRPSQTNQQINSVVLRSVREREFLYFCLLDLRETINQYGANGVTMVNLNKTKFENLRVIKPEAVLVHRFHSYVAPMFEQVRNCQESVSNLGETRDLLLPKLISGEVRFEQVEAEAAAAQNV